jgi:hypothetical protein
MGDVHGLAGRWFHTWREPREDDELEDVIVRDGLVLEHQGRVVERVDDDRYLVETFSWWTGQAVGQRLVPVCDMAAWTFYESALEMHCVHGCDERFRGRRCGLPVSHFCRHDVFGLVLTCADCSTSYAGMKELDWDGNGKPAFPQPKPRSRKAAAASEVSR